MQASPQLCYMNFLSNHVIVIHLTNDYMNHHATKSLLDKIFSVPVQVARTLPSILLLYSFTALPSSLIQIGDLYYMHLCSYIT